MSRAVCPLCGSTRFDDHRGVPGTRCRSCKSNERTRVAKLFLDRHVRLEPGMRVLHFAPDIPLGRHIAGIVGSGYEPVDLAPERYEGLLGLPVGRFDICRDASALPAERYDLVLHNHVMEHLPCNVTLALQRLHRAVKPGGAHLFSIPILDGASAEDLAPGLSEADRVARFGQGDHMRRFGRDDFALTVGAVFGLTAAYSLTDFFPEAALRRAGVRPDFWTCSGSSVFYLRKAPGPGQRRANSGAARDGALSSAATCEECPPHPRAPALREPTMSFDNRSAAAPPDGPPERPVGLHFAFRANGKRILYAYIRKNACSSFKRLIVSRSPHKAKRAEFPTSLRFLQRFHAERGGVEGYDHAIFVIRDPAERLVSVYKNKFVQRDGHGDIFANYAAVTGEDPEAASFEAFMTRYVGRPFETLDQHVRPQADDLLPAVYSDAIPLDELHARMTGIVGARMADRFFLTKLNATSRFASGTVAEAWSAPSRDLHRTFLADGTLPATASLLPAALRARAGEVYARDVALFQAVASGAARPAATLQEA